MKYYGGFLDIRIVNNLCNDTKLVTLNQAKRDYMVFFIFMVTSYIVIVLNQSVG